MNEMKQGGWWRDGDFWDWESGFKICHVAMSKCFSYVYLYSSILVYEYDTICLSILLSVDIWGASSSFMNKAAVDVLEQVYL